MNFKRYVEASDTWVDSHYIMDTSTDTITTLPADIYANDTTATVGLKGNMSQSGTPSPDNPIQPQETGERTGNLFDATTVVKGRISSSTGAIEYAEGVSNLTYSDTNNEFTITTRYAWIGFVTEYLDLQEKPAFSYISDDGRFFAFSYAYDENKNYLGEITSSVPTDTKYIRVSIQCSTIVTNAKIKNIMLNVGSEPLPFEPFGVKIPISSANTTTPIYLGEVPTTRNIRKLVLDGTEKWRIWDLPSSYSVERYFINVSGVRTQRGSICSHFLWSPDDTDQEHFRFGGTNLSEFLIFIKKETVATITDFKSYLAAQYAAGTPVTIWYVLATEETAVVNEPIRKIGTYADEVSGITIPTIAGGDTLSVDTTLQPSEVTVNYHGWHEGTVHERENGAWT